MKKIDYIILYISVIVLVYEPFFAFGQGRIRLSDQLCALLNALAGGPLGKAVATLAIVWLAIKTILEQRANVPMIFTVMIALSFMINAKEAMKVFSIIAPC